jgi:hypothetical protein
MTGPSLCSGTAFLGGEYIVVDGLTIRFSQLRKAFELVADYLAETEGTALPLSHDYFWAIPAEELYDVYNRPASLTIGQLSESWQHIEDLLDGKTDILGYDLIYLSDVLRAIGQDVGPWNRLPPRQLAESPLCTQSPGRQHQDRQDVAKSR